MQVPHSQGFDIEIAFRRVDPIPIEVEVNLTTSPAFPSNGLATMRANLAAWAAGMWDPGVGVFDTAGLGIGQSIDTNRLLSPLNAVPGHVLGVVTAQRVGGAALGNPNLDQRYTLETDAITLVLS